MFDAVFLLDSAVLGVEKVSVVCRTALVFGSFAGVSLVCLDFAPRRGDAFFPLGMLGLRRLFRLDTIVDRRRAGRGGCVDVGAALCRVCVG